MVGSPATLKVLLVSLDLWKGKYALERLPFSVSSPKTHRLQSLCELSTLNRCCDSIYNGKLNIFCVEYKYMYIYIYTGIQIQYCIQVSDLNPIKFSWNFSH